MSRAKKKICVYRALTFSSCIALLSQSISPFIQGFIHLPLLKPAAPLLPSLLLLYYVSSLPPSFSLSALVLDSGRFSLSRLRRMGLQLMTFLVRKKNIFSLPPSCVGLCLSCCCHPPYLSIFLLSQSTFLVLLPSVLAPPPHPPFIFQTSLPPTLSLCNKSDKIRDCISPLSSPSLKRVSCLRRGST